MPKVRRIRHQAIKVMSWFRKMKKYWESQKVLKVIYSKATSIVGSLVRQTARWSILLSHCYQLIQILLCCVWQAMRKFWGKPRQNPREKSGGSHYLVYLFLVVFVFVRLYLCFCVFWIPGKESGTSAQSGEWWVRVPPMLVMYSNPMQIPPLHLSCHRYYQLLWAKRQTTLPLSSSGKGRKKKRLLIKNCAQITKLVSFPSVSLLRLSDPSPIIGYACHSLTP